MKSKLLGHLLANSVIFMGMLISTHAYSALTILAETREGLIYIDQSSLEKTTSTQKVAITQDFHEMQALGTHEYLSSRSWYEVDCAGKQLRQTRIEIFLKIWPWVASCRKIQKSKHGPRPSRENCSHWSGQHFAVSLESF